MKKVFITKPCKTNMQSGYKKTKSWIVEFSFDSSLDKDVLMGWNSSSNTNKQV
ncbi:MAG: NADH dehydrogenase ubiquinone Fe-S protein 4, partial [Akkermansiaceae bacterium]